VMSLALGLGASRPAPAGVLALSGFIPRVEGLEIDPAAKHGLPVLIAHGTLDPVISIDFARDARSRLEGTGVDLTYHESPIPHTIDPRLIPDMRAWLGTATGDAG
jgi:phospholipase/carboxylesterase